MLGRGWVPAWSRGYYMATPGPTQGAGRGTAADLFSTVSPRGESFPEEGGG